MTDIEFRAKVNEIKHDVVSNQQITHAILLVAEILHDIELHLATMSLENSKPPRVVIYEPKVKNNG